jgi:hypothetical protein
MNAVKFGADFTHVWVYVAGPFAGSALGAALFILLHIHRSVDLANGNEDAAFSATDADPVFSPLPSTYQGAAIARVGSGRGFVFNPSGGYGSAGASSPSGSGKYAAPMTGTYL